MEGRRRLIAGGDRGTGPGVALASVEFVERGGGKLRSGTEKRRARAAPKERVGLVEAEEGRGRGLRRIDCFGGGAEPGEGGSWIWHGGDVDETKGGCDRSTGDSGRDGGGIWSAREGICLRGNKGREGEEGNFGQHGESSREAKER